MNTPATKLAMRSCVAKPTASVSAPAKIANAARTVPKPATVAASATAKTTVTTTVVVTANLTSVSSKSRR